MKFGPPPDLASNDLRAFLRDYWRWVRADPEAGFFRYFFFVVISAASIASYCWDYVIPFLLTAPAAAFLWFLAVEMLANDGVRASIVDRAFLACVAAAIVVTCLAALFARKVRALWRRGAPAI